MSEAEIIETTEATPPPTSALVAVPHNVPAAPIERVEVLTQELSVMEGMWGIAEKVARTPFAAAHGNKVENVFAAFMKGHEVGLQPMQALDSIDVIQGKPTLKPETMRALIRSQGHDFEVVEQSDQRCVMLAHRKAWPSDKWTQWEFTISEARDMKLLGKDNWQKQPAVMLFARCTSKMGRGEFADVLKGLSYTPDEILESISVKSTPVETPNEVAQSGAPALQEHTESGNEWADEETLNGIRTAIATLTQESDGQLREWWKANLPNGATKNRLKVSDAQKVSDKIKSLPKRAPETEPQATASQPVIEAAKTVEVEIVKVPTPPSTESTYGPEDLLKVVFREREITQPQRVKVASWILKRPVKRMADLFPEDLQRVAKSLEAMTDEEVATMLLEVG